MSLLDDLISGSNEAKLMEMKEIKSWFDITYTQKEQKYNRLISLGKLTDSGENPQTKLNELYQEAERKRKRYQELEK